MDKKERRRRKDTLKKTSKKKRRPRRLSFSDGEEELTPTNDAVTTSTTAVVVSEEEEVLEPPKQQSRLNSKKSCSKAQSTLLSLSSRFRRLTLRNWLRWNGTQLKRTRQPRYKKREKNNVGPPLCSISISCQEFLRNNPLSSFQLVTILVKKRSGRGSRKPRREQEKGKRSTIHSVILG